jgi:hypothetical protein
VSTQTRFDLQAEEVCPQLLDMTAAEVDEFLAAFLSKYGPKAVRLGECNGVRLLMARPNQWKEFQPFSRTFTVSLEAMRPVTIMLSALNPHLFASDVVTVLQETGQMPCEDQGQEPLEGAEAAARLLMACPVVLSVAAVRTIRELGLT